jgi:DNA-binding transcriptional MerR regulator
MAYTPADARKFLGIAESTLSNYSRLFAAFLSPKQPNHQRRYTQEDLMVLKQVRYMSAQGTKLKNISHFLVIEDLEENKNDETGQALANAFESLSNQVQLLAEILQAQELTYKKLLKIEQQRNDAISSVLRRLKITEEKVNQDARFLLAYKKEFQNLRNLVYDHKNEKHNLASFLGL